MSRFAFTLVLGCAALALACREQPAAAPAPKPTSSAPTSGPVFRLHFAGLQHVATNASSAKLNALLNTPEAVATRKQVHDRLAVTLPSTLFGPSANTNAGALLRPLLDELAASKFLFETHDPQAASWMLTVFLDAPQRTRWSTNLWQAVGAKPVALPPMGPGTSAWSAKTSHGHLLTVASFDDCLMVSKASPSSPLPANPAPGKHPALSTNLVDLIADLARLQPILGLPLAPSWPQLSVTVNPRGEALRSEATLKLANAKPWQLTAFRLPTNSVRDPLISFTAVQGFGDWLARLPDFKEWELKSAPNQFFTWARSDVPYNVLAAAPMPAASNAVASAAPHALHTLGTNVAKAGLGRIAFTTNRTEIGWVGMPILVPFVRPAPEPGDDFLLFGSMAGIIPTGPNTNPPPAELLNQFLPRTNLVYYDWEITEAKLAQWVPIFQLASMLSPNPTFPGAAAASQWLRAVSPKLGNAITEVTVASPAELKAVRRSELGLTAFELAVLTRWLDNPAFPAFAYPTNAMTGLPTLPTGTPKPPGK